MNDAKLAQIRALLAKAESTEFPPERDAFTAKAAELIAKYGIDEALLAAESAERSTVGQRVIVIEGSYLADKRGFLHTIYSALGCQTFAFTGPDRIDVQVFGYDSDLDRAELLYTSLLIQALRGMQDPELNGRTARNTFANRRVWLRGFRNAVYTRLVEAERRARRQAEDEHGGVSTALVLRDRSAAVRDTYDEYVTLYKAGGGSVRTARSTYSGTGYRRGVAAGERADIGHGRVGGQKRSLHS